MIIDFHTHTFPDKIAGKALSRLRRASHTLPFTNGTADALSASMKAAGIDMSVILPVATNPAKVPSMNDAAAALNQQEADRGLLSFGCMHPDFPDWYAELERIAQIGLKGIKLHPVYQDVDFDDPRYIRILERAGELGLTVLIHAGLDVGYPGVVRVSPEMIFNAVRAAGPVRLVLAHMGGWRCWQSVTELLVQTDAYLDTSFSLGFMTPDHGDDYYKTREDLALLTPDAFMHMIRAFGAERILFGTDSPWGDQTEQLNAVRALPLTEQELSMILGGNAQKLLGLAS